MGASNRQVGGAHYKTQSGGVQHWDYCVEANIPNLEYAASKYISRWRKKNGLQDLKKALHYIEKRIESYHNHVGILRGSIKKEELFDRFVKDNSIPVRERLILDAVMHWKRVDQLIGAHAEIESIIKNYNVGEATPTYVNQD